VPARLRHAALLSLIGAVIVSGCGGGSSGSNVNIGNSIQGAFLSALDNATTGNGTTSYTAQFTIYQCDDQNSGVPLDQLTTGDLASAQGSMLFHCELTRNVSSSVALAPSGSDGWLYYLEVKTGGNWDAQWEPLPVTSQDQIPPCSGALCNEPLGKEPPDHVTGDENSGHVVSSGGASTSSAASAPTATGRNSGSTGSSGTAGNSGASSTGNTGSTVPNASNSGSGPGMDCGTVKGGPNDYQGATLTVYAKAGTSCARAMRVMTDLGAGRGENHQGTSDATSYILVDGWTCPYGNMDIQTCAMGKSSLEATAPGAQP
jgi:hypothetical protein